MNKDDFNKIQEVVVQRKRLIYSKRFIEGIFIHKGFHNISNSLPCHPHLIKPVRETQSYIQPQDS